MGKNLKSLGQWFKHEESVLRERGGSHVMHGWRGGCQLHHGTLPLAWHPRPKDPDGAIAPQGLFQGTCPAQAMPSSAACRPSVPSEPGWHAGSLLTSPRGREGRSALPNYN